MVNAGTNDAPRSIAPLPNRPGVTRCVCRLRDYLECRQSGCFVRRAQEAVEASQVSLELDRRMHQPAIRCDTASSDRYLNEVRAL